MAPKFAIASLSLGNCAHHQLPTKIRTASSLGYDGIEIFIPDFEAFVHEVRKQGLHRDLIPQPPTDDDELEIACAKAIASLCASLDLEIPVLQPLRSFENFVSPNSLGGGAGLPAALKEAERWLRLMPHLNTQLLLVCSNYIEPEDHPFASFVPESKPVPPLPDNNDVKARTTPTGPAPSPYFPAPTQEQLSSYLDAQVEAFRELGKLAAQYGVRIGYEPLAWGTMVDNWEQVWDVVRRVDLENVGVILDSFNCLANQYADPAASPTFLRDPASCSQTPLPHIPIGPSLITHIQPQSPTHAALLQNLSLLSQTIPADKIFLYQVADAALPPPDGITLAPRAPARMTWSRASRLFPLEEARSAWLPVTDFSLAIVEAGYPADEDNAWWSLEVFNKSLMDERPECVEEHGVRGIESLRTLWERVAAEIKEQTVRSPTPSDESALSASDSSEGIQTPPSEDAELSVGENKCLDEYVVE